MKRLVLLPALLVAMAWGGPALAKSVTHVIQYGSDGTLLSPLPQIRHGDGIVFVIDQVDDGLDVDRHLFWLRYQCPAEPTDWMRAEFTDGDGPLSAEVDVTCIGNAQTWAWELEASKIDDIGVHRSLHPALEAYAHISDVAYSKLARVYYEISDADWTLMRGYMAQADFWARAMENAKPRAELRACRQQERSEQTGTEQPKSEPLATCHESCLTGLRVEQGITGSRADFLCSGDLHAVPLPPASLIVASSADVTACESSQAGSEGDGFTSRLGCLKRCVSTLEAQGVGRVEAAQACGDTKGLTVQDVIDEASYRAYRNVVQRGQVFGDVAEKPTSRSAWLALLQTASDAFWQADLAQESEQTVESRGTLATGRLMGGGPSESPAKAASNNTSKATAARNEAAVTDEDSGVETNEVEEEEAVAEAAEEEEVDGEEEEEEEEEEEPPRVLPEEEEETDPLQLYLMENLHPRTWLSRGSTAIGRRDRVITHDAAAGRFSTAAPAIDDHDRVWVAVANSETPTSLAVSDVSSFDTDEGDDYWLNLASVHQRSATEYTGEPDSLPPPLPYLPLRDKKPERYVDLWSLGRRTGNTVVEFEVAGSEDRLERTTKDEFTVARTYHIGFKYGLVGNWVRDRDISFSASDADEGDETGSIVYEDGNPPTRHKEDDFAAAPIFGLAFYLLPHDPTFDARRQGARRWVPHGFFGWSPTDTKRSFVGLGLEPWAGTALVGGVTLGYAEAVVPLSSDDQWKIESTFRPGAFLGITMDVSVLKTMFSAIFPEIEELGG